MPSRNLTCFADVAPRICFVKYGLALIGVGLFAFSLQAQEDKPAPVELTEQEAQFIELCGELDKQVEEYYREADKIADEEAKQKYLVENNPEIAFVERLIQFEAQNHGTHAGLMAARILITQATSSGNPHPRISQGRQKALAALPDYSDNDVLPEVLRFLNGGALETRIEPCLRKIMAAKNVTPRNRQFAQYMFARCVFTHRMARERSANRLAKIQSGAATRYPDEVRNLERLIESAFPASRLPSLEGEAIEFLRTLSKSEDTIHQTALTPMDENWRIIRVDEEKTKAMPTLGHLAEGLLFKELHLSPGRPAPDLQLKLTNGKKWTLAEQLGKTVVIQFSYKGCGPCQAMYPDLRKLTEQYPEQLEIVSVMADENEDVSREAVESGKMTWNVSWDGHRGPVATRWAVQSFPTIYVIDSSGKISALGLRGHELRSKIAELTGQ